MMDKTRAIVLHQVKYGESGLIVTLFTEKYGCRSYIASGIHSSKSKIKQVLFQPLFIIEIDANYINNRELHRISECRLCEAYQSIPFDVTKSSIAMFISEVLYKVVRSEEPDAALFEFMVNSLLFFDGEENGTANFHLWFLIKLCDYLGFKPVNNYNKTITPWFSLKLGEFVAYRPALPNSPDIKQSRMISVLLDINPSDLANFETDGDTRSELLATIIEYYSVHFEGISKMKSLEILNEVFAD